MFQDQLASDRTSVKLVKKRCTVQLLVSTLVTCQSNYTNQPANLQLDIAVVACNLHGRLSAKIPSCLPSSTEIVKSALQTRKRDIKVKVAPLEICWL